MNAEARRIQNIYLLLLLLHTLAASFIWGINTLFLLDAGLNNVLLTATLASADILAMIGLLPNFWTAVALLVVWGLTLDPKYTPAIYTSAW